MKLILPIVLMGVILLVLLMDKKQVKNMFEVISIYWFRLAFSFFILFMLNVVAGFFGVYVPINLTSGLVIAVLGIPGLTSILAIAFLF